jgi:Cdc6-like AAA superfamily ATPase
VLTSKLPSFSRKKNHYWSVKLELLYYFLCILLLQLAAVLSPQCMLVLGVANALDLTDRILPRLQAKPKCRPKLLHFAPYTRDQITAVIVDRLAQVSFFFITSS